MIMTLNYYRLHNPLTKLNYFQCTCFKLQSYFITGVDGYTLDLTPLSDVCANITTLRMVNPSNADVYDYDSSPYYMRDRARKPSIDPEKITVSIRN